MIRGYRWIKTAPNVWQYEGPSGSRRFHGIVTEFSDGGAMFCVPGGYSVYSTVADRTDEYGCGERASVRLAKDEIEKHVRGRARGG